MDVPRGTLGRLGKTVGYWLAGLVGTAILAVLALNVSMPLQRAVYDLFYLRVGPSEATVTAILAHFLLSAVVALGATTLLADLVGGSENRRVIGGSLIALVGAVLVYLLVALAGGSAVPTALVVLVGLLVSVPLALRYRYGVRSGAIPAFLGGVPVVLLLLVLAGVGIGWGWGYVVTAQEVPASSVNGSTADFDEAPEVREDLFVEGDCETGSDGRRECHLQLRGYDHEPAATRFLARHGVRCPYQSGGSGRNGSLIAEHDGRYYRVTCSPHGD